MLGDATLFTREDEVDEQWKLVDAIVGAWERDRPTFPDYAAGSWLPAADELVHRDGTLVAAARRCQTPLQSGFPLVRLAVLGERSTFASEARGRLGSWLVGAIGTGSARLPLDRSGVWHRSSGWGTMDVVSGMCSPSTGTGRGRRASSPDVQRQLAEARSREQEDQAPELRASTMTHVVWAAEWLAKAHRVLIGLEERIPRAPSSSCPSRAVPPR